MADRGSPAAAAVGRPFQSCAFCGHDPKLIVLDPGVWSRIVFAAKESEDWRLRTLVEQAVMGPVRS